MRQNEIAKASVGDDAVKKMCVGETQVWPTRYDCVLMAVPVTDSANYTMSTIPAAGGQATVQYWAIISQSGREITRYIVSSQYLQIQFQEEINSQWVTPQNFTNVYDSANTRWIWHANDRGNNGVHEGDIPQNAPARKSRVKASYSGTYQNVAVGGETQWIEMTQNGNNVRLTSSPYVNLTLNIDKYKTSASPAPAKGTSATDQTALDANATASYDQQFNYQFYDAETKTLGVIYQRVVVDALTSENFTFSLRATDDPTSSVISWASIQGTPTSSGATVRFVNRETDNGDARSAYLHATYSGTGASVTAAKIQVYQQANKKHFESTAYNSYTVLVATAPDGEPHEVIGIDAAEQWVYLFGTALFIDTYSWPSQHPNTTEDRPVSQAPTRIACQGIPDGNIDLANRKVKIPANTGISGRTFTINGYYTYNSTEKGDDVQVSQGYVAITFGNLSVVTFEYEDIPAYGGTVRPTIGLQLELYQGTRRVGVAYGRKEDDTDASTIMLENVEYGVSKTATITYYVNDTLDSSGYGAVYKESRGHNEDTYDTTAAENCWIHAVISDISKQVDSSKVSVMQTANHKHIVSETVKGYSFYIYPYSVSASQSVVSFYGVADYDVEYSWDSNAPHTYGETSGYENPSDVVQQSGVTASINLDSREITIPENQGFDDREFVFRGYLGNYYDDVIVSQSASTSLRYDTPIVGLSYEELYAGVTTGYPTITVSQKVWAGNTLYDTLEGRLEDGYRSGTARGDHLTASFEVHGNFEGTATNGATFYPYTGGIKTASRGTTPSTTTRNVATGVKVYIDINGLRGSNTAYTAVQEANIETVTPPYNSCSSLTLSFDPSSLPSAGSTWVAITARASGTETAQRKDYASGEHTGGEETSYTNRIVTLDTLRVNGSYKSDKTGWTADNSHTESTKEYTVVGTYGDNSKIGSKSITQAADAKSDWLTRDYIVSVSISSNTVSASGGQASISASGSHTKYKKWTNSDNADVAGTVTTGVADTPTLSIVDIYGSAYAGSAYWLDGSTLKHRNMGTDDITESVKVRATNNYATADTSIIQASNTKQYGTISMEVNSVYIAPSETTKLFKASCPITFTSGASGGTLTSEGFNWSFRLKGNDGKRDYTFGSVNSSGQMPVTFGSLGTNEVTTTKDTVVRATLKADSSRYKDSATLTEQTNTTSKSLTVNWSNPSPINGIGGSINVGVVTATYNTDYTSGASVPTSVAAATIAASIQLSGSGFSKSYSSGNTYVVVSAAANPDYSNSRSCTLTATYMGKSASTEVVQKNRPYRVEYTTSGGKINAVLYNTNSSTHNYTFNVDKMENGVHTVLLDQIANNLFPGFNRTVAGVSTSPSSNSLTVSVTKVDGETVIT